VRLVAGGARPIFGIGTQPDPAAKRGVGPVLHTRRVPMFDRIEVNIIEMPGEIVIVTQRMLPVPSLPNPALAFAGAAGGDPFASPQTV
jgi:hypothetical protein